MTTNDDIISDNKAEPHYHSSNNQQQKIEFQLKFISLYFMSLNGGGGRSMESLVNLQTNGF